MGWDEMGELEGKKETRVKKNMLSRLLNCKAIFRRKDLKLLYLGRLLSPSCVLRVTSTLDPPVPLCRSPFAPSTSPPSRPGYYSTPPAADMETCPKSSDTHTSDGNRMSFCSPL